MSLKKIKVEHRGVAERFATAKMLKIDTKTIGTRVSYNFCTCNISKSGILMRSDKRNVPFRENTILEMTIDPDGVFFQKPVAILGKVVRRVDNSSSNSVDLGVSVIQLDSVEMSDWNLCIDSIKGQQEELVAQDEMMSTKKQDKRRTHA